MSSPVTDPQVLFQRKNYGWTPDLPDARDHVYAITAPVASLPTRVDLRSVAPQPFDQGDLGSCTANAISAAHITAQKIEKVKTPAIPSRLFIYYNERVIEGTVASDSGAQLRDGMKSLNQQGVCSEYLWPYNIAKFAVKPPALDYMLAIFHQSVSYKSITGLTNMRLCLASGYPFVFGFTVYESFESDVVAITGVVPMPGSGETVLGGHAVACYGYDDSTQRFLVLNSWGRRWGQKGYFTIPYEYLNNPNLASDFWQLSTVK